MKRILAYVTAGALALAALPAAAAGTATLEMENTTKQSMESMSYVWNDAGAARMGMPGEAGYMVVRDGATYMVSGSGADAMVIDLGSLQKMMGDKQKSGTGFGDTEVISVDATGETETVAGISGEVYDLKWRQEGSVEEARAVLSDHPLAFELTRGWATMADAFGTGPEADKDGLMRMLMDRELGLLKVEGKFEIAEISDTEPDAALFELPAEPMTFQEYIQKQMQQ
ncbi:hypothetical protein [Arhodomonas sp. AD133]|uniref:hypothetical protein n=1 Tax=Arhodomonas sp. AD133 TaxID=3415009 RepID=UPI003EBC5C61